MTTDNRGGMGGDPGLVFQAGHGGSIPRPASKRDDWTTLGELRKGAIFETEDGIRAVKSEYHYGNEPGSQCQCVLLESGEYAHFPQKNRTRVREIILEANS